VIVKKERGKYDRDCGQWGENNVVERQKFDAPKTYGRDWKRKTKVAGTFVGGERTVWKVFKRWQCDRMHEKKTKTSGNFGKKNKSWRVTGSKRA
jgi:hypothetical protein